MCSVEESLPCMLPISSVERELQTLLLPEYTRQTEVTPLDTSYCTQFKAVLRTELPNGLIPHTTHVCLKCHTALVRNKQIPREAIIMGLYQGSIPLQLQGLTAVEQSMIAIYKPITKAAILGGMHYVTRGATTFTVVNDVAAIAAQLPSKPDRATFTTLRPRRRAGRLAKDYTFRPFVVQQALLWLKTHNVLYKDVSLHWYDAPFEWSSSEAQDIPYVELDDDDVEGVDLELDSGSQHPANPGSSGFESNVLLLCDTNTNSSEQELRCLFQEDAQHTIRSEEPNVQLRTGRMVTLPDATSAPQFVNPHVHPEYFYAKSFPVLFPYGRGCPSDPCSLLSGIGEFANAVLKRGGYNHGRRFQQDPNFYFAAYTYETKRKIGGVSYLAQNQDLDNPNLDNADDITAGELDLVVNHLLQSPEPPLTNPSFNSNSNSNSNPYPNPDESSESAMHNTRLSKDQIQRYIARMVPFSNALKGTALNIAHERKKLLAMIASPILNELGSWRWFVTFAPADNYDIRLYEICMDGTSGRKTWNERHNSARELTLVERERVLKNHPALAARLFDLKQRCIWDYVLKGRARPFGEIVDTWRRVEFQMRGTPHVHALLSILFDGVVPLDLLSADECVLDRIRAIVDKAVTALLEKRAATDDTDIPTTYTPSQVEQLRKEEDDYDFTIAWEESEKYFDDMTDPRKEPFDPQLNYYRAPDGTFASAIVQQKYRRLQLANQLHRCNRTCHKYQNPHEKKICRFGFPFKQGEKTSSTMTSFVEERDKHARMRMYVYPKRDNAHLNNTAVSPLLAIAHGGNHDIKYIDSPYGTAEYVASYSSKAEAPDLKVLQNLLAKRLHYATTDRARLNTVATALVQSTEVGAVQACYTLLNLDFVQSSRTVINVNSLHRSDMNRNIISSSAEREALSEDDSAIYSGLGSQLGRRKAYEELVKQQRSDYQGCCYITFYLLLTYYSLNVATNYKTVAPPPPLLKLDKQGHITNAPDNFQIGTTRYTLKNKAAIVNLSPHIAIDAFEEKSCYSTILLHYPWPLEGEQYILAPYSSAVQAYHAMMENDLLPSYVTPTLTRISRSENARQPAVPLNSSGSEGGEHNTELQNHDSDSDDVELDDRVAYSQDDLADFATIVNQQANTQLVNHVTSQLTETQMRTYKNFLGAALNQYMADYALINQSVGSSSSAHGNDSVVDHSARRAALDQELLTLHPLQKQAFDRAIHHIQSDAASQLIMFTTGEGGTGKSKVIAILTEYLRLEYGKQPGLYGAVIVAAPTGTSANNINGFTWQSVLGKSMYQCADPNRIMSVTQARKVAENIKGARLFILDEVSLVSLESLHTISESLKLALAINAEDEREKTRIMSTPFGGMHMFIAGDLWQLRCIRQTAIYDSTPLKPKAIEGRKLWLQINEFVELTENCRFINASLSPFAQCMSSARIATPQAPLSNDLLNILNTRVCAGPAHAKVRASKEFGSKFIWITNSRNSVNKLNNMELKELIRNGNPFCRSVARHTADNPLVASPNSAVKQLLFARTCEDSETYVDLAIGSRVRCIRNIATQIGIFNGAVGTVVGFGYYNTPPTQDEECPPVCSFHTLVNREIPVVFVRMDKYTGIPLLASDPCVVPFSEIANMTSFKVHGKSYTRWQLPLALASAITTHRAQSLTARDGVVVDPSDGHLFARSLAYVSCSRATELSKILFTGMLTHAHFESHPEERVKIAAEYDRLRRLRLIL